MYYVHYHKLQFAATSHGNVQPVHSPCENNTTNSRYLRTHTTFLLPARYTVFIIYYSYMFGPQNKAIFREIHVSYTYASYIVIVCLFVCLFVLARQPPNGPGPPHSRGF
jgi:hypothetical protein